MDCKTQNIPTQAALPDSSRIWIYQANRKLTGQECKEIAVSIQDFTSQWKAHQQELAACGFLKHHRFIILAVDEQSAGASGCSIDSSVRALKSLEEKYNIQLFDRLQIAYMNDENEVYTCSKAEFQQMIDEGKLHQETLVFNNLIQTLGELKNKWLVTAKESWHGKVFKF